jgi:hypothetical protein
VEMVISASLACRRNDREPCPRRGQVRA